MITLGLNRGDHDAAACVVRDGRLESFINVERITRSKHDGRRIWEAARYCLEVARAKPQEVDLVVQNSYIHDLEAKDALSPSASLWPEDAEFVSQFPAVETIPHHLAHAYCGVALAPYDDCAVIVADGIGQALPGGQAEAESFYAYRDGELKLIHRRVGNVQPDGLHFHSFDSIGAIYSAAASYIFGHWNLCGKVMGLAAYGRKSNRFGPIVTGQGRELQFDLGFRKELQRPRERNGRDFDSRRREYEELSYKVQQETEEALLRLAQWIRTETGSSNLVFSGGLALNCVANQKILAQAGFRSMFVPPPAGDEGIAIGCAFWGWFERGRREKRFVLSHPYYGRRYEDAEIRRALDDEPLVRHRAVDDPGAEAARLIDEGNVVGWFQGAGAMGPRALGNRSILADPRTLESKDRVNRRVKHREPFRPFGASVLAERASEFFECEDDKPYMTFAVGVRKERAEEIPAVVHADGTCRHQSVRREDNPAYHHLISKFAERTGLPVVLNTSFNTRGEPIVESPRDAIRCLLVSEMDALILGNHVVERSPCRSADGVVSADLLELELHTCSQFDVVEQRYPGGHTERSLRDPVSGRVEPIPADGAERQLLDALDTGRTLGDVLAECGADGKSARRCVEFLWRLRGHGWIRLVRAEAQPETSACAAISSA